MNNIELLYIDLFCGAGGTSSGVEYATVDGRKCAEVIACVNHDANAIKSHAANHPKTMHFTEDIRTLDLAPLVRHLQKMKRKYQTAKVVLWASLECTNFSKAKGGQPPRCRQPHAGRASVPLHRGHRPRLHPDRERGGVHVLGRPGRERTPYLSLRGTQLHAVGEARDGLRLRI